MTRSLQAIFERGVLRPLEPLPFREMQEVTVTVSDETSSWVDSAFLSELERQADDRVTLNSVRSGLAKIPGSMADDFHSERDDRF